MNDRLKGMLVSQFSLDEIKRRNFTQKFGLSCALSFATSIESVFPYVFHNEDGYWAFSIQFVPLLFPAVIFLAGDPVCDPKRKGQFIHQAIHTLELFGHVCAIQAHKETVNAMSSYSIDLSGKVFKKAYTAHQLGVESVVSLPYPFVGNFGQKLRGTLREGYYVEEIIWEDDTRAREISEDVFINIDTVSYEVETKRRLGFRRETIHLDIEGRGKKRLEGEKSINVVVEKEEISEILDEIRNNSIITKTTAAELVKLEGNLGSQGHEYYIRKDKKTGEVVEFGYYFPMADQVVKNSFISSKDPSKSTQIKKIKLLSGSYCVASAAVLDQLEEISRIWLSHQINPLEMGAPLLKPFKRNYEPGRRVFAAKKDDIFIAFIDFDPIHGLDSNGETDLRCTGYYANMVRTNLRENLPENVSSLIIGAAMHRFVQEGHSVLNLGLNPLGLISELNSSNGKKTIIDRLLNRISHNPLMNDVTYAYEGVMEYKQNTFDAVQNVADRKERYRKDIPTYVAFNGFFPKQLYDFCMAFLRTGAIGPHVWANIRLRFTYGKDFLKNSEAIIKRGKIIKRLLPTWDKIFAKI